VIKDLLLPWQQQVLDHVEGCPFALQLTPKTIMVAAETLAATAPPGQTG
jgi:hypothetical protein